MSSIVHDQGFNAAIKEYIDKRGEQEPDAWHWLDSRRIAGHFKIGNSGEAYYDSKGWQTFGIWELLEIVAVLRAGEAACRATTQEPPQPPPPPQ